LSFSASGNTLTIEAPVDGNLAPPGYYMMFLVDSQGIPSLAAKVRVTDDPADAVPPSVSISEPGQGAVVLGAPRVAASASDDIGVAGVQLLLDGAALGPEDVSAPFELYWDTTLVANGPHTLAATARDATGNTTTSSPVDVTVSNPPDATPPNVSLTSPLGGEVLSGVETLAADASDDVTVVGVRFFVDGAPMGDEDLAPPYQVSWNTHFFDGPYTVTAQARDAGGNATLSAGVGITVDNGLPPAVAVYGFEEAVGSTDPISSPSPTRIFSTFRRA